MPDAFEDLMIRQMQAGAYLIAGAWVLALGGFAAIHGPSIPDRDPEED